MEDIVPSSVKVPESRIVEIISLIEDETSPIADVCRLIALEIAGLTRQMVMPTTDVASRGIRPSQKDLNDQVKSYRELQRTLVEGDNLSKKDVLNLDGEKFKHLFTAFIGFFKKALKEAGLDETVTQNVMLQFSDIIKANDEGLRVELNRIGTGK